MYTYEMRQPSHSTTSYYESMTENLWALMVELTVQQAAMIDAHHGGDVKIIPMIPKEGMPCCLHCCNMPLHKLLENSVGEALAKLKESPDKNLKEIC
jgi:hypothetical protein